MKPERIQIFPSGERWELVPARGRMLLPCVTAKDASFLVGAATHLGEKFGLNGLVVTAGESHAVTVTFETESHEGFTTREQELLLRIEDLWSIVIDPLGDVI
jgi:hypothetical protein